MPSTAEPQSPAWIIAWRAWCAGRRHAWTCARELVGSIWATGMTASHQQVGPHWGAATICDRSGEASRASVFFRLRPGRAASAALGGQRPRGAARREARIAGTAAVGRADKMDRGGNRAARDLIAAAKIVVPATAGRVTTPQCRSLAVPACRRTSSRPMPMRDSCAWATAPTRYTCRHWARRWSCAMVWAKRRGPRRPNLGHASMRHCCVVDGIEAVGLGVRCRRPV